MTEKKQPDPIDPKTVLEAQSVLVLSEQQQDEKKRGRKRGAKNKRSDALRRYCADRFGIEPGELLIETVFHEYNEFILLGHDPGTFIQFRAARLSQTMGLSGAQALATVTGWMTDLMPYIHQRLPQAVEITEKSIALAFTLDGKNVVNDQVAGAFDMRPQNIRNASDLSATTSDETPENADNQGEAE